VREVLFSKKERKYMTSRREKVNKGKKKTVGGKLVKLPIRTRQKRYGKKELKRIKKKVWKTERSASYMQGGKHLG